MLPPIKRVYVQIEPLTWLLENGGVLHKIRVVVEAGQHHVIQELMLRDDDFESRFDQLFEMAKRTLRLALEREAKISQPKTEMTDGEAQEAGNTAGIHAQRW